MERKHTSMLAMAIGLTLLVASGAGAQTGAQTGAETEVLTGSGDLDAFRAELAGYVSDLEMLPVSLLDTVYETPVSLTEARAVVEGMNEQELRRVRSVLDRIPYWRALPRLLATSLPTQELYSPIELAATLRARFPADGPATFRAEILRFVSALEALPGDRVSPSFRERIARLQARITGLSDSEVLELRGAMAPRIAGWKAAVAANLARDNVASQIQKIDSPTRADCTSLSFPNDIFCEIDHVIDEIAAFGGDVIAFFTDAFNSMTTFFEDLFTGFLDLLPPDPTDLKDLMEAGLGVDLDDPDWIVDVFSNIPLLEPPCPANGTNIPLLGVMGTVEARFKCSRSIDWISQAIYDNAPDDVWGIPLKFIMAAVYYPINYLCLCFEGADEIEYDRVQGVHRDLVTQNLDVRMSTRATEASALQLGANVGALGASVAGVQGQVDGVRAGVADLDADVARVEAKLDGRLDETVSSRATQNSLNEVDDEVAMVEAKLDIAGGKVDDLQDQADQHSMDLVEFHDLALRLRIEADLARHGGDDAIALFQMPQAVGGQLELARDIVLETIEQREAAGRDMSNARRDFDRGDDHLLDLEFKDAYDDYRRAYQQAVKGDNSSLKAAMPGQENP